MPSRLLGSRGEGRTPLYVYEGKGGRYTVYLGNSWAKAENAFWPIALALSLVIVGLALYYYFND